MTHPILEHLQQIGIEVSYSYPYRLLVSQAGMLTDELRHLIRSNKPALVDLLMDEDDRKLLKSAVGYEPPEAKPGKIRRSAPRLPGLVRPNRPQINANWLPLAQAHQRHLAACPVCKGAAHGHGLQCGAGAALMVTFNATS